jgi:hypothetical protein
LERGVKLGVGFVVLAAKRADERATEFRGGLGGGARARGAKESSEEERDEQVRGFHREAKESGEIGASIMAGSAHLGVV